MRTWVLVLLFAVAACGASEHRPPQSLGGPTPPVRTTGSASESATPAVRPALVRSACRRIEGFVDTWREHGYVDASRRYVVPGQQVESELGLPRIVAGSVDRCVLFSAESPDRFILEADLTLHLRGDPLAWNEGVNTRFVTATRSSAVVPFRLELATSP
jgi:hypothetical protein